MKKSAALLIGSALVSMTASAQFSAGLEVALPDWEGVTPGVGASVCYEHEINENLGVTGTVGYISVGTEADFLEAYSMIPAQVGARYYLNDRTGGIYGQAQVGIHSISATTPEIVIDGLGIIDDVVIPSETVTDSYTSFAIGAGYVLSETLDASVRYNSLTYEEGSNSYIGLRVGYTFGSGE